MPSPEGTPIRFAPMPLATLPQPFDHPDWLFELKYDGFRALAHIEPGRCRLVSRNYHQFKTFPSLCSAIAQGISRTMVLDGEIVHIGKDGKPQFYELMRRRGPLFFFAFDVLSIDGRDLRRLPLFERKKLLRGVVKLPVIFVDHIERRGTELFDLVCQQDLEGVVAKAAQGLYQPEATTWVKIKNRTYSQAVGRREFFDVRVRKRPALRSGEITRTPAENAG